ncbi:MAG TPA: RusA family crossover junction endodeoxyribonuclease [Nitrososphaeraceae archaeon]|nr:RusA family crossover junction endodeoxyribonuclease [Nitrososphaeraceae archaeon]
MFKMILYGEPISKKRHRTKRVKGKIRSYDPQEDDKIVTKICMGVQRNAQNIEIIEGPLSATFSFYCTPNQVRYNDKIWGLAYHTDKPDIDNMIKYYLDCANEIVFADDKQIVSCTAQKYYSSNSRTEIIIEKLPLNEIDEEDKKILYNFSPKQLQDFSRDCQALSEYFEEVEEMAERGVDAPYASVATSLLKSFAKKWSKVITKIGKV